MARGTVKWFSESKGFGFIAPEEGNRDLFFCLSNIVGRDSRVMQKGQIVEYSPPKRAKSRQAHRVSVAAPR